MIKQSWALLVVASFTSALGPPPHRMDEGSLRSALNAVNRKQRSLDSSADEYLNDLHSFKFYSGQDRDHVEDIEFLPFENGQLETIGDGFQKFSPSGHWTDKKPDTNLGTRLFDRMIVQYLGKNGNLGEAVPSAFRERDRVGGQKRSKNGEGIDDRQLAKLFIEELQDETFPNQVEVDDGDDVDNFGFWYNKQRLESANKNKGFDFSNTPKSWSSTFGKQSAKDQVRDPLYASSVEHRDVNSRFPLEREYKEYREFRKRYPVTKRSPTSIQPKTEATDQKAARDLGDLFGVKSNDHHGHTHNHEHDHDHVHSHDHHHQQTSEAPNPTTHPKDEEEKVMEQSEPRKHPMEIKKKSLDWSQYFGIDKRKKKSTLLARPGTQDQDDEWLLQQYYKTMAENLKPSERVANKDNSEKRNMLQQIDSRLKNLEDLIIEEPLRYTGSRDAIDIQKVKDNIMARAAASYCLEKMRRALNEFQSNVALEKQAQQSMATQNNLTTDSSNNGSDDKRSGNILGRDGGDNDDESCQEIELVERRCKAVDMWPGNQAQVFYPLCVMHQICRACVQEKKANKSCDKLFSLAFRACEGHAGCLRAARVALSTLLQLKPLVGTPGLCLCELQGQLKKFPLSCPRTLEEWLRNMAIDGWYPTEESLICSDHFDPACLKLVRGYLTLRDGSIPSVFSKTDSIGNVTVTNEKLEEVSSVTKDTVAESFNEEQFLLENDKDIEVHTNELETIVTCPQCNHSFNPKSVDKVLKRKSVSEENFAKRLCCNHQEEHDQISESRVGIGFSTPQKEELAATSFTSQRNVLKSPDTAQKRNCTMHDHRYEASPVTAKKNLHCLREANKKLRRGLRLERQRCSRLSKKVTSLQEVVGELRRTRALPDNSLDCLDTIADTDVSEFMKRFSKNANSKNATPNETKNKKRLWKSQRDKCKNEGKGLTREKYPPSLRAFALTLHFHSAKAYAFVRSKFCRALPEPSTLRAWYSAVNGEPGFTSESFEALKSKVSDNKFKNKRVLCSLMLDEVSIKKGINRAPNGKVRGYIDLGTDIESSDSLGLAKDALVIMAVSVDANWKLPIGYFLIDGLTADISSNIVTQAITRLHDVGVEVLSLTLDGPPTHFALLSLLGASFKMPSTQPFFPYPVTKDPVYVVFDACHMLKLFRNCLGDYKTLKDGDGRYIEWRYITALAHLQQVEGLRAGNKLAHINYFKMKMKVRLAAQTLSSSVADSLEHCDKILKLPQFSGCEGTVRFIRCIDRLFDFMNSRNPFGKGYKAPLRRNNEYIWRSQIQSELDYLSKIQDLTGKLMTNTKRYVAFVGMFTAVQSVMAIFDSYVKPIDAPLNYLLTYKLSQDHLELFFCAIRCCGGWSPIPTAAHFVSAYKRLLIQQQVRGINGNVTQLDSAKILHVSSSQSKRAKIDRYNPKVYDEMANARVLKKYDIEAREENDGSTLTDLLKFQWMLPKELSDFSRNSISYIAGYVLRKVFKMIKCKTCRIACIQDSPLVHNTQRDIYLERLHAYMQNFRTQGEKDISLILQKNRGGLLIPSDSVVEICQLTENSFRRCLNMNKGYPPREPNFPALLCSQVLHELFERPSRIFPALDEHNLDEDVEDLSSHVFRSTKEIIKAYVEIRMFSASNLATGTVTGVKIRHHLSRQIIWNSQ